MAPTPGHSQAVLPNPGMLVLERIDRHDKGFEILVTTRQAATCPICKRPSTAQHSGYTRRLADLPWQGLSVRIRLSVHRYRCRNHKCARRIFCERVPGVARVYSRCTERLEEIVGVVGMLPVDCLALVCWSACPYTRATIVSVGASGATVRLRGTRSRSATWALTTGPGENASLTERSWLTWNGTA